ncbi:M24 family metallopeptidase [Candidatus Protochlamydia amoebophila]|nr:Xaa-Pro peptidase family protein [Candidatus Protochlamydia amoebophila]
MNYVNRLCKLREKLSSLPCDVLLIEHPTHILYLTGLELSAGKILVSENQTCLIVDGRYLEICNQQTLYPVILLHESALTNWLKEYQLKNLGIDPETTTFGRYSFLSSSLSSCTIIPIPSPLQEMRLIKDEQEIIHLKESAKLALEGYHYLKTLLQVGVTEAELAFELEFFWKKKGAKQLAFDPIIAFGFNSSKPHYRADKEILQANMPVLIDIGVVVHHYHSDMTRVDFFGNVSEQIQSIYSIVEEAKHQAMHLCKPGTLIGELDNTARSFIESKGYGDYFTHSLGHGIGLDIHESPTIRRSGPFSDYSLQAGMVITIEPGIYLKGVGGVRLEDTLLITETGYEILTQ